MNNVSPSISLKPTNRSEDLMIYEVSSIPSSKEALLPVSSGASLTESNDIN